MKRILLILTLSLLAACGGGAEGGDAAPAPARSAAPQTAAPEPSPTQDTIAACKQMSPLLGTASDALGRAESQVITYEEATATLRQTQQEMDTLADTYVDPDVQQTGHDVADGVGMILVAIAQGGDVNAATGKFSEAGERFVAACQAAG